MMQHIILSRSPVLPINVILSILGGVIMEKRLEIIYEPYLISRGMLFAHYENKVMMILLFGKR